MMKQIFFKKVNLCYIFIGQLIVSILIYTYFHEKIGKISSKEENIYQKFSKMDNEIKNGSSVKIKIVKVQDFRKKDRGQSIDNVDDLINLSNPGSIIILTYGRTGSSFTGQILASHSKVLYFFEPLNRQNSYLLGQELNTTMKIDLLKKIVKCDFLPFERFHIRKVNNSNQESECKRHIVVIKTILIENLNSFKNIVDETGTKIIHLVRDPRAIYNAQKKVGWSPHIDYLCQNMLSNAKTGREWKNDKHLSNNYFLLKYEDLALQPVEKTRELFKFLGLTMESNIIKYIEENTVSEDQEDLKNPYSLKRNSKNHISIWRRELSLKNITTISEKCKGTIQALGYQ